MDRVWHSPLRYDLYGVRTTRHKRFALWAHPNLGFAETSFMPKPLPEIFGDRFIGKFIITFELNEGGIPGEHWAF